MKRYSVIALICTIALICATPSTTFGQKKRAGSKRPAPAPPAPDMRPEALLVSVQIKNVSKFLYIYGKVVNSLEVADEQAKSGQVTPALAAKNKQSQDSLVANISGLRIGLENLVKTFQANPRLQVQYLKVSYAAEAASSAEKLATAGRYDDAGKSLVGVIDRLTDALISMRLQ